MIEAAFKLSRGAFSLQVNLQAKPGEVVALLGASGSGKSLTLRALAGLEPPDSGLIRLNDQVLYDSDQGTDWPPQQRRMGYLFQDYALFPTHTVKQNLMLALREHEKSSRAQRHQRIDEILRTFHLEHAAHQRPRALSGGMRQRVALARLLINEPKALLLDEPFSALDGPLKRDLLWKMIEALRGFGGPVLWVTHDLEEARAVADRIYLVDQGQMKGPWTQHEFFENPPTPLVAKRLGSENLSTLTTQPTGRLYARQWGLDLPGQRPEDLSAQWVALRPEPCWHQAILQVADQGESEGAPFEVVEVQASQTQLRCRLRPFGLAGSKSEAVGLQLTLPRDRFAGLEVGDQVKVKMSQEALWWLTEEEKNAQNQK